MSVFWVFWEGTALRQDSLQTLRWASHLLSPQLSPPVSHWWLSWSTSLPFGTFLEKIPKSRPFLCSPEARENNTVILWHFTAEWRYLGFGDLFQKYFIIILVLSTSSTTLPSLSSLLCCHCCFITLSIHQCDSYY